MTRVLKLIKLFPSRNASDWSVVILGMSVSPVYEFYRFIRDPVHAPHAEVVGDYKNDKVEIPSRVPRAFYGDGREPWPNFNPNPQA